MDFSGTMELVVAALLAAASLTASLASYQAALWSGANARSVGMLNALRNEMSIAASEQNASLTVDIMLFSDWVAANRAGNRPLATFYEDRFPREFRPVFDEWMAQRPFTNRRAVSSPFALPSYRQARSKEVVRLSGEVEAASKAAANARRTAESYTRTSVVFAMSIFLGGIGSTFRKPKLRVALALLALVVFGVGLADLVRLPFMFFHA